VKITAALYTTSIPNAKRYSRIDTVFAFDCQTTGTSGRGMDKIYRKRPQKAIGKVAKTDLCFLIRQPKKIAADTALERDIQGWL
jgi:hypothetical protein